MEEVTKSDDECHSDKTRAAYKRCQKAFLDWKGSEPFSDDLVCNYVRCYLKGSDMVCCKEGTYQIAKHKASSTRTMFSHLLKYLNSRDDSKWNKYQELP